MTTDIMTRQLLETFVSRREFGKLQSLTKVMYPDNREIVVTEYTGSAIRVCLRNDDIRVLFPKKGTVVQEGALIKAISNGTIFDDAEKCDHHASYLKNTMLPMNALANKGCEPKKLQIVIANVVGKMNDEGEMEFDHHNGETFMHDIMKKHDNPHDVFKTCHHHMDVDTDGLWNGEEKPIPDDIKDDIKDVIDEIDDATDVDKDDEISDNDYDDFEEDDDDDDEEKEEDEKDEDEKEDEPLGECFISQKPKKLKEINDDIFKCIEENIGHVSDKNEKSKLAGFIASKLEIVDFYLNCVDSDDSRYIIPHSRDCLLLMQGKLDGYLRRVLEINPSEQRPERIWDLNI